MNLIFLLFIATMQSALSLCPKATFEGTEYYVESNDTVPNQCKTRHVFNKEGMKYCLRKKKEDMQSSIDCGELLFPKPEISSSTLSQCQCDITKIAGGQDETDPKWTVALTVGNTMDSPKPLRDRMFCTGSLITQTSVLTAAHCLYGHYSMMKVYKPDEMKDVKPYLNPKGWCQVVVGLNNVNNTENTTTHEVEKMWAHPGYKHDGPIIEIWKKVGDTNFWRSTHQDDIAIMRIEKKTLQNYNPICLPPKNDDPYANVCVKVSGWGRATQLFNTTHLGNPYLPETLQVLNTTAIKTGKCRAMWKDAGLFGNAGYAVVDQVIRDPIMICHDGIFGSSICSGDSGGPTAFTTNEKGKLASYVIGVTAFGPADGCGTKVPHVSTRVSHYVDWIRAKMDGEQPPRCGKYWSAESCACC